MTALYEAMFLLDNDVVRADWNAAKSLITDAVSKHGGSTVTARRFDERRLAYPIKRKNRATYLLCYLNLPGDGMAALRREFELDERVLRYLFLAVDEVPDSEKEHHDAELADDFTPPPPPEDDAPPTPTRDEAEEAAEGEKAAEGDGEKPAEGEGEKTDEAKASEAPAADSPAEGGDAEKTETTNEKNETTPAGTEG